MSIFAACEGERGQGLQIVTKLEAGSPSRGALSELLAMAVPAGRKAPELFGGVAGWMRRWCWRWQGG
jgi:hypothetical protein